LDRQQGRKKGKVAVCYHVKKEEEKAPERSGGKKPATGREYLS